MRNPPPTTPHDLAQKVAERLALRFGQRTFTVNDAVIIGASDLFWLIRSCHPPLEVHRG